MESKKIQDFLLLEVLSWIFFVLFLGPGLWLATCLFEGIQRYVGFPGNIFLLPLSVLGFLLGVLLSVGLLSLCIPKLDEGIFPFPLHRTSKIWVVRLVLHRLVFMPVLTNIIFASPFLRWFVLKSLGAKVAFDTKMSSDVCILDPELFEMGEGSMIGGGSWVSCHTIDEEDLALKKVVLGKNVNIFIQTVLFPGVRIADDSTVGLKSLIAHNVHIGESTYLGMNCLVGPDAKIGSFVVIGHKVLVCAGAIIEDHAIIETGAIVPKGYVVREGERFPKPC